MKKILCIDDDPDVCLLLQKYLSSYGFLTDIASTGGNGLKKISETGYDLVLCDFRLPDYNGFEMITKIQQRLPYAKIIIMTGYADARTAVKVLKFGVHEYITKPVYPENILRTINAVFNNKNISDRTSSGYLPGQSEAAITVQKQAELVAPTGMTVLLSGESGTGKEVMAKEIHRLSDRKHKNFVTVDCGSLPAGFNPSGYFEQAEGGTLFLDEIANLCNENQAKLLRAFEERKTQHGNTGNVRIIVSTNHDLRKQIRKGSFREDIYHRINEFHIRMPALAERKCDLQLFLSYFLDLANTELGRHIKGFTDEALAVIESYNWPGNLRELKNAVKRAVLLAPEGSRIGNAELPSEMINEEINETRGQYGATELTDLKSASEIAEKNMILSTLAKTGNNKSKAAEILKVDRKTLYNKLAALGIGLAKSAV